MSATVCPSTNPKLADVVTRISYSFFFIHFFRLSVSAQLLLMSLDGRSHGRSKNRIVDFNCLLQIRRLTLTLISAPIDPHIPFRFRISRTRNDENMAAKYGCTNEIRETIYFLKKQAFSTCMRCVFCSVIRIMCK